MKARFKTIILSALGALSAFSIVTYVSCNEDKCKTIVCAYGGVCSDGTCICPNGYEGPQCETITRDRYIGNWTVTEDGSLTDAAQYTISVEKGDNLSELRIKNFYNYLVQDLSAFVTGDTMVIPQQTINNRQIQGWGVIKDDKFYGKNGQMTVFYKVVDNFGNIDDFGVDGGDPSLWNK